VIYPTNNYSAERDIKVNTKNLCYITAASFIILALLINSSVALANEGYYPSSWSSQKIAISETAGITPESFDAQPFTKNITRQDFCELLINTCRTFGITLPAAPISHPFTDTRDITPYSKTAYPVIQRE